MDAEYSADSLQGQEGETQANEVVKHNDVASLALDIDKHETDQSTPVSLVSHEGLRIIFKDVSYTVKSMYDKGIRLKLLDNVSGCFQPGEMCALLGPNGSGKSTLLDVLAGRKTLGQIKGQILFGGTKPTSVFLRRHTGYVEQFDTLISTLTVYEMLLYTAELKRPLAEPLSVKKAAVENVIKSLALEQCRNVAIGNNLRKGISGGQSKRVNVGIALVSNPKVLFLDEPSSGLDSFTSNEVMEHIKGLSKSGITICSTIHSPTAYAFGLFDRLIMLLRGKVIYFGLNDADTLAYFRQHAPIVGHVRESANPALWIVDLTTKGDRQGLAEQFAEAYQLSNLYKENMKQLKAFSGHLSSGASGIQFTQRGLGTVTPFWWAQYVLFKYRTLRDYCNPSFLGPRICDKLLFSLIISTGYLHVGNTSNPARYSNIAAVLFMWIQLPAFAAASATPVLVMERPIFIRERSDGMYHPASYLVYKLLGEVLIMIPLTALMCCYTWFALELSGLWPVFWLAHSLTLLFSIVLAYFISSISATLEFAGAALPTFVVTLLFFSGFLLTEIPPWWIWYSFCSPLRYAWGALMVNQFNNCSPQAYFGNQTVLEFYSLTGVNEWIWLTILLCFSIVFAVATLFTLTYMKHQKR